jgi:hypothetical protein
VPENKIAMPFTLSHPAAAVPLARGRMVLSALVIGSMMPDLPYFIPLFANDRFAHTLAGLFYFCVPMGLAMFWIFHRFLKLPLLSLLPVSHQARLASVATRFRFGPSDRFGFIVLSLLAGALTHVSWDLLTHSNGWGVQHLAFLRTLFWGSFRMYLLLQYGSTVLGLALLAFWYWRWFAQAPVSPMQGIMQLSVTTKLLCWAGVSLGPLLIVSIYSYLRAPTIRSIHSLEHYAQHAAVAILFIGALELLLFAALWHCVLSRAWLHIRR